MKRHTRRPLPAPHAGPLVALVLAMAIGALPGCPPGKGDDEKKLDSLRDEGKAVFGARPAPSGPGMRKVPLVRLGATAVAFPAGTMTKALGVWTRLDARPWPPDVRALLTLNGVQVGLMKAEDWPELAKTFEDLGGKRLRSATLPAYPNAPVPVFLRRADHHQTIFTFRADGTMFGMDYPPGDMLVSVHCMADPMDPTRLSVGVMPQIQTLRHTTRLIKSDGRYATIKRPTFHNMDQASWRVSVKAGQIIMIGPGAETDRKSSLGRRLFFRDVDGTLFETVLLLSPTVTMVNASGGPLPPPRPGPTSRPAGKAGPGTAPTR